MGIKGESSDFLKYGLNISINKVKSVRGEGTIYKTWVGKIMHFKRNEEYLRSFQERKLVE